jgi:predicted metalloprotease with PDZ domain
VNLSTRARKVALAFVCLSTLIASATRADVAQSSTQPATVRYVISLAGALEHRVRVKMLIPPGPSEHDLQLPVWNALYQIRDFSQYVNWVHARSTTGHSLPFRQLDKSRWHVNGSEEGAEIEYEIFADQSGPFGAQLNGRHAFFNLAEILLYPVDERASAMHVQFADTPAGWRIATALPISSGEFVAENYDRLVDSPVEIGAFQESDFDEAGGHYRVVVDADPADYDIQKIVSNLRALVSAATLWMADRPYQTYLFLYHFPRGVAGGGMEHAYTTAIDISATRLADTPQVLADLTAHEFFHLWNVKRIRPQGLEPVDFTKENYTTALWFSEGVTTTAGNIILLRAGLLDEPRYLKSLAAEIGELERRPAHRSQSAEDSSMDAWLEKYDYYRLPVRSISYYNKGNLLGVRWMNENYARKGQFFPDSAGVRQAAEVVSHADLEWFFEKYVAGTEEIPWNDFFKTVGLHLAQRTNSIADTGFVAVRNFDAPPAVAQVTSGGEAERSGLTIGDVILEIDGRIATSDFEQRLAELRPGDKLHLRVRNARGDHDLHWKVASQQEVELQLVDSDNITPQQRARRAAWLRGDSEKSGESLP